MSVFLDLVEEVMEIFTNDFFVYGSGFESCLENLETVLQRCKDKNLDLNWEKCHFMVMITTQIVLFFTLINTEHFLCTNKPN